MNQLKVGVVLSYANIVLTNVLGLILTPFIIRSLGTSEYGLYTLMGSVIAYLSIMDFGLGNTVVRFVAQYRANKDKAGEQLFLGTTMFIYILISIVLVGAGMVVYYNLESIFGQSLTAEEMEKAKPMFLILLFNLGMMLPGSMFTGICNAYERFIFSRLLLTARYLLRVILIYAILTMGGDSIALVLIDTVLSILMIGTTMFYVFKLPVKFRFNLGGLGMVKTIFAYSVWVFVAELVAQFQWQGGQVILGIVSNTTEVAIYGVGIMLGTYYGAFASAISGVFLPRATFMVVNKATPTELTDMMTRIGRLTFFVLLFILGGFILYGRAFVILWLGAEYSRAYEIALIIMLAYTIPLTQTFIKSIVEANKKVYFRAIVQLIFVVIGIPVGYYLNQSMGSVGMVLGITLGWMMALVVLNVFYARVLHLQILRFFMELFNKLLFSFLSVVAIAYILTYFVLEGWIGLFVHILAYSILYVAIVFKLGLFKTERQLFYDLVPMQISNRFLKKK